MDQLFPIILQIKPFDNKSLLDLSLVKEHFFEWLKYLENLRRYECKIAVPCHTQSKADHSSAGFCLYLSSNGLNHRETV